MLHQHIEMHQQFRHRRTIRTTDAVALLSANDVRHLIVHAATHCTRIDNGLNCLLQPFHFVRPMLCQQIGIRIRGDRRCRQHCWHQQRFERLGGGQRAADPDTRRIGGGKCRREYADLVQPVGEQIEAFDARIDRWLGGIQCDQRAQLLQWLGVELGEGGARQAEQGVVEQTVQLVEGVFQRGGAERKVCGGGGRFVVDAGVVRIETGGGDKVGATGEYRFADGGEGQTVVGQRNVGECEGVADE